ncbi:MAG: urea carboxylase-associated family protein [Geminicoccaceae bacterium]
MSPSDLQLIPARMGSAARVKAGQTVRVINTHGTQVVDTWAFSTDDLGEFMSMQHTRAAILKLRPAVGDSLVTNCRRPILTLTADTSGGVHDTLIAACDRWRYEGLGHKGYHRNCTDNLSESLRMLGLIAPETPSPLNLFMNIPWTAEGTLSFDPPRGVEGGHVDLRAEMDLVIAFSACPQDMLPINGEACVIHDAHFQILDA